MNVNPECTCRICGHGLEDHDFVVVDSQVVEVICLSARAITRTDRKELSS